MTEPMPDRAKVRAALAQVAIRDGVTLDQLADSFQKLDGTTPNRTALAAALAAMRFTGDVNRRGDLYFSREVGGPDLPDHYAGTRGRAVDFIVGLPRRHEPVGLKFPLHPFDPAHRWRTGPLDGFVWEHRSDRVSVGNSDEAGEWTLLNLRVPPPAREQQGAGWYLYGPDVTSMAIGSGPTAQPPIDLVNAHVALYVMLRRSNAANAADSGGPAVPDHVRAAIHAGHVGQVGIFCDRCGVEDRGDYTGETREDRFAAARRHLTDRKGWLCTTEDLCPLCRTGEG